MRPALIALLLAVPLAAHASEESEERQLAPFHAVDTSGGIHVVASAAPTQKVEVHGSASDRADLVTEVKDGVLELSWKTHFGFTTHSGVSVVVAVPKLDRVEASGGASAKVTGLPLERAEASGGGSIEATDQKGKLKLELSGGASATVSGPGVDNLAIEGSGGADVHAFGLPARAVSVEGSGGGRFEVAATEALAVTASGGAKVVVQGHPSAVTQNVSGGGSVVFK
ncbi:MAG: DUF2807 domain-containing protein [Deltaproteobacteria bacterium]|nr:DUF2807 domain-containing protein [Deltaproteobacteria bacterium]